MLLFFGSHKYRKKKAVYKILCKLTLADKCFLNTYNLLAKA